MNAGTHKRSHMMDTGKYRLRFVHKIAAALCVCGHSKYSHHNLHEREGSLWGHGLCIYHNCDCCEYLRGGDRQVELLVAVVDSGDIKAVTAMLWDGKYLPRGERLLEVRRKGAELLCFFASGIYQSIIIEPWAELPDPGRDVVRTENTGIYRIRWTRNGYRYVTSAVNGGLLGAFVNGRWDDGAHLHVPETVRVLAER